MSTEAIMMMIFSITVLWGGLAYTSAKLIMHNRAAAKDQQPE